MAASRALLPSPPYATANPTRSRARLAASAVLSSSLTLAAARGGGGANSAAQLRMRCAVLSSPAPVASSSEKYRISRSGSDAVLREFADVECAYGMAPDELLAKASQFDALIVHSGTKVTREVLEAGKGRLWVVGRAGVGIDNVDLQASPPSTGREDGAPPPPSTGRARCELRRTSSCWPAGMQVWEEAVGPMNG